MGASRGAKQLAQLPLTGTEVVGRLAAAGLRATKMSVSNWRRGTKLPDREKRWAIYKAFGIKVEAWDDLGPQEEKVEASLSRVQGTSRDHDTEPATPTAVELAWNLLLEIQDIRKRLNGNDLGGQEIKALVEAEGKCIDRYSKLSGQAASERDILTSPHFTKVLDEMFAVLEKFPDALRALAASMSEEK